MKSKRIISAVLVFMMLITLSINVFASEKPVTVHLDGSQLEFDVNPIIDNGRTLVPMRKIFESLGATVDWIDETRTATAVKGDIKIEITIDKYEMFINDKSVPLDVPAQLINGRTLVPARAVSEGLQAKVDWNETLWRVIITSKEGAEAPKKIYDITELSPADQQQIKSDEYTNRFMFEQARLPDSVFAMEKDILQCFKTRDQLVCDFINVTWDANVTSEILYLQSISNYTYNLDILDSIESELEVINIYQGLVEKLRMNSASNFRTYYSTTPGGRTAVLIDFYSTDFGFPVPIVTEYIAIVNDNGRCRYFSVEILQEESAVTGEDVWILSEITETTRGSYGSITMHTEKAFLGAIDQVIDEQLTTEMTDRIV